MEILKLIWFFLWIFGGFCQNLIYRKGSDNECIIGETENNDVQNEVGSCDFHEKNGTMNGVDINNLPTIFDKFKSFKKLLIKEIDEVTLKSDLFEGAFIKELNIVDVKNLSIESNAFRNAQNLNKFQIKATEIGKIYTYAFTGSKIKYLEMIKIDNIELDFQSTQSLTDLIIVNSKIEKIVSNQFSTYLALEKLSLKSNEIGEISEFAFMQLNNLIELDLQNNKIEEIKKGTFKQTPALKRLILSGNSLIKIEADIFLGAENLENILLDGNQIETISPGAFKNLKMLNELQLEGNQIQKLFNKTFEGLENLRILNLSNQKISDIQQSAFEDLTALRTLNLSNNQLKKLNKPKFAGAKNLITLDLSKNKLEKVTQGTLQGLNLLAFLHLNNNQINILEKNSFENCQQLRILNLEGNLLETIRNGAFTGLKSLRELNLKNNSILNIEEGTFVDLLNDSTIYFEDKNTCVELEGNELTVTVENLQNKLHKCYENFKNKNREDPSPIEDKTHKTQSIINITLIALSILLVISTAIYVFVCKKSPMKIEHKENPLPLTENPAETPGHHELIYADLDLVKGTPNSTYMNVAGPQSNARFEREDKVIYATLQDLDATVPEVPKKRRN